MNWEQGRDSNPWISRKTFGQPQGMVHRQKYLIHKETCDPLDFDHPWEKNWSQSIQNEKELMVSRQRQVANSPYSDALIHYGVKGMHWGEITKEYVPKGTRSGTGIKAPSISSLKKAVSKTSSKVTKGVSSGVRRSAKSITSNIKTRRALARKDKNAVEAKKTPEQRIAERKARNKKIALIGAVALGTALAVYGAKKYADITKAKAYANTLSYMTRTQVNGNTRQKMKLLGYAESAARQNSSSFRNAFITNQVYKRSGQQIGTQQAKAIYSGKDKLKQILDMRRENGATGLRKAFNNARSRKRLNSFMKQQGAEYTDALGFHKKATRMVNQSLKKAAKQASRLEKIERIRERTAYKAEKAQAKQEAIEQRYSARAQKRAARQMSRNGIITYANNTQNSNNVSAFNARYGRRRVTSIRSRSRRRSSAGRVIGNLMNVAIPIAWEVSQQRRRS